MVKNPPANAENVREAGSIPGSARSTGERSGNPLQYPCLENPMGRGAWRAAVHRVAKSQRRFSNSTTTENGQIRHCARRCVRMVEGCLGHWGVCRLGGGEALQCPCTHTHTHTHTLTHSLTHSLTLSLFGGRTRISVCPLRQLLSLL